MNNNNVDRKIQFEDDKDFQYRINATKIIKMIGPTMGNIEDEITKKTYNFFTEKRVIEKEFEKFKSLEHTDLYEKTHEFNINAFECILKALEILLTVKENQSNLQKAYKYIDSFVCWTKLSNAYMFIALENREKEAMN